MAGLGNPGYDYRGSYHNVGYQSIDWLLREYDYRESDLRPGTVYDLESAPVPRVAKPDCYVNQSGSVVESWVNRLDLAPESLLVLYDDFSLDLGEIRIRPGGSAGGHNGMKSIIEALGNQSIPRLRIGIGPLPEGVDPAEFVLSPIQDDDQPILESIYETLPDILQVLTEEGVDRAMSDWNGDDFRNGS